MWCYLSRKLLQILHLMGWKDYLSFAMIILAFSFQLYIITLRIGNLCNFKITYYIYICESSFFLIFYTDIFRRILRQNSHPPLVGWICKRVLRDTYLFCNLSLNYCSFMTVTFFNFYRHIKALNLWSGELSFLSNYFIYNFIVD